MAKGRENWRLFASGDCEMHEPNIRVIPRLDIKNKFLIKSIQLEGLRKIGRPNDYALKYYLEGADELLFNDCVASLYGRNSILDTISETAKDVFIPLTVSGGILSVEEAQRVFRAGAIRFVSILRR